MKPYFYLVKVDDQPDRASVTWSSGDEIAIEYGRMLMEEAHPRGPSSCAVVCGEAEADQQWLGVWD